MTQHMTQTIAQPQIHILGTCPYCNRVFDQHKMIFNTSIGIYNCVECRQMIIRRANERRIEREHRQALSRLQTQTTNQLIEHPTIPISAIDHV